MVVVDLSDLSSGSSFAFSAAAAAKDVATELSTLARSFSLLRVLRAIASSSAAFCRAFLLASSCKCRWFRDTKVAPPTVDDLVVFEDEEQHGSPPSPPIKE